MITAEQVVRVGLTEAHGMAREQSEFPPPGVEYRFLQARPEPRWRLVRSPIKGFMRTFEPDGCDLIESLMSPLVTRHPWLLSCANFQEATAFDLLGLPTPRALRVAYVARLMRKPNFKKLVFWSESGGRSLQEYGGIDDPQLLTKVAVVYPAVRRVPDERVRFGRDRAVTLLFSGDFFRKGGVNVLDAFARVRREHPGSRLLVCCDERIDFNTPNAALRAEYLAKLRAAEGVEWLGRLPRARLLEEILPQTDIYLLPTYAEAFGMAVLEAMAFGIPVISMNHGAIPEMLEHEVSGLLIDVRRWDCERLFRGYVIEHIPEDFRAHVTEELFRFISRLAAAPELREALGRGGLEAARTRFTFATRNARMLAIYREALA